MSSEQLPTTITFNAADSSTSILFKVRDSFELLTERLAFIESLVVANRSENNEELKSLNLKVDGLSNDLKTILLEISELRKSGQFLESSIQKTPVNQPKSVSFEVPKTSVKNSPKSEVQKSVFADNSKSIFSDDSKSVFAEAQKSISQPEVVTKVLPSTTTSNPEMKNLPESEVSKSVFNDASKSIFDGASKSIFDGASKSVFQSEVFTKELPSTTTPKSIFQSEVVTKELPSTTAPKSVFQSEVVTKELPSTTAPKITDAFESVFNSDSKSPNMAEDSKPIESKCLTDVEALLNLPICSPNSATKDLDEESVISEAPETSNAFHGISARRDHPDSDPESDLPIVYDYDSNDEISDTDLDSGNSTDVDDTQFVAKNVPKVPEKPVIKELNKTSEPIDESLECKECGTKDTCSCSPTESFEDEDDALATIFSRQSISNSNTDSNNYESARSSLNSSNQEKSPRKPNDENTSIFGTPSTVLNESKNIDKWNGTPAPSSVFMDSKNIDKSSIFGTPTSASTSLFNDTPRSNGTPTSSSSKLNDSTEVRPSVATNGTTFSSPTISSKSTFGQPKFGAAPKTFGDLKTDTPFFLNKTEGNPFAVDPRKNQIFAVPIVNGNNDSPTSSLASPNRNLNPLAGLAPGITGEEDCTVWLNCDCRLYQYYGKNKTVERGFGNLKLLENPEKKLRCVMRRDRILKLCLNFNITSKFIVETSNQANNILTWSCIDFSNPEKPEGEASTFICRFREDDAIIFKKVVKTHLEVLSSNS